MRTNDYEKAKSECWRLLCNSCIIKGATRDCFDTIFDRAYQLGKAHTQSANGFANERLQVAAMAMQGILSNSDLITDSLRVYERKYGKYTADLCVAVANVAVVCTDTLITEINKPKNETDKED